MERDYVRNCRRRGEKEGRGNGGVNGDGGAVLDSQHLSMYPDQICERIKKPKRSEGEGEGGERGYGTKRLPILQAPNGDLGKKLATQQDRHSYTSNNGEMRSCKFFPPQYCVPVRFLHNAYRQQSTID